MSEIDLIFIQTNAFIQGYAKAMENAKEDFFNLKKATEEYKKKLEAK